MQNIILIKGIVLQIINFKPLYQLHYLIHDSSFQMMT